MAKVTIDQTALHSVFASEPWAQTALDETTDALIAKAEDLNPDKTGYSKKRYRKRRFRLSRRWGNYDPFFHLIEFGSANNPVYAPMRKAPLALGLKLKENPKATSESPDG